MRYRPYRLLGATLVAATVLCAGAVPGEVDRASGQSASAPASAGPAPSRPSQLPSACGPGEPEPLPTARVDPQAPASLVSPDVQAELPPADPVGSPWLLSLRGGGPKGCALDGVVSWARGFVATTHDDGGLTWLWLSGDGYSWTRLRPRIPGAGRRRVRVGPVVSYGDGLMLFGTRGGRLLVWRSEDGKAWRAVPGGRTFRSRGAHIGYQIAVSGRRILVMGATYTGCEAVLCPDEAVAWTSADGDHWRRTTPAAASRGDPSPYVAADVTVGPAGFLTLGPEGVLLGSRAGARWRPVGSLPQGARPTRMVAYRASDGYTYMVDDASAAFPELVVRRSSDLRTWAEVYRSPYPGWIPSVWAVGDGGIVISGYDQGEFVWALSSTDGVSWDLSAGWPGMEHGDITGAAVDGRRSVLVALGQNSAGNLAWVRPPLP